MQEESHDMPNSVNSIDQEFLRKYSFGRRIPRKLIRYCDSNDPTTFKIAQVAPLRLKKLSELSNVSSGQTVHKIKSEDVAHAKTEEKATDELLQKDTSDSGFIQGETDKTLKEELSDPALLKSVFRARPVTSHADKLGLRREPQVIVRQFNIPVMCPANKSIKLKERWKYQHDVVGMANISPSNTLHTVLKTKPVVSYSIASFVNSSSQGNSASATSPSVGIIEPIPCHKLSTNAVLPKNHTAGPSRFPSPNRGLSPNTTLSLPSTIPTAVVKGKPIQVLAMTNNEVQVASSTAENGGKYIILKPLPEVGSSTGSAQESGNGDSEPTTSNQQAAQLYTVTQMQSAGKITKSNTIVLQGSHITNLGLEKEPHNGKRVINPFIDSKDGSKSMSKISTNGDSNCVVPQIDSGKPSAVRNGILSIPVVQTSGSATKEHNTIHLEIVSKNSTNLNHIQSGNVTQEMGAVSSEEDGARKVKLLAQTSTEQVGVAGNMQPLLVKSGDNRTFAISRQDGSTQMAVIAVPSKSEKAISQLLLKTCQPVVIQNKDGSVSMPIQAVAPAPVAVPNASDQNITCISSSEVHQDISVQKNSDDTVLNSQKEEVTKAVTVPFVVKSTSDVPLKLKAEKMVLKPVQNIPVSTPLAVTALTDCSQQKMKNELSVAKLCQVTASTSQQGSVPSNLQPSRPLSTADALKRLNTRQSIALRFQRDMMKARDEIKMPRFVTYPARTLEAIDTWTQTSLFSLLEPGRLVEMTISGDAKGKTSPSISMPSPSASVPNKPKPPVATGASTSAGPSSVKRIVSVDSRGLVAISSSPSTEPLCKKLRLDDDSETGHSNIFKLLRPSNKYSMNATTETTPNTKNINKTVNINVLQQNAAVDTNHQNSPETNSPKLHLIDNMQLIRNVFNDWQRCLFADKLGNIPLHHAVFNEDVNLVKRQCVVLSACKNSLDVYNFDKETPLHIAIWLDQPVIVSVLLEFGAQPNAVDGDGNNAFHLAVIKTSNSSCLEVLLKSNFQQALLNAFNDEGFSPLHLCALNNKETEAVLLAKYGANVNLKDAKSGRTALFHSVEASNSTLSRLLVHYGASASIPNFAGHTPLLATNDISMLGSRAMASVVMTRSFLRMRQTDQNEDIVMTDYETDSSHELSERAISALKLFDQQDR